MGSFNRDNRVGGRNFNRRGGFNDRRSDRPVEMHRATCDQCHKDCEVPFRPTSGKPIYCKNCFEGRNFDRPADKIPFQPIQYKEQFEALNNKLDKILKLLTPDQVTTQPVELKVEVAKKPEAKKPSSKKK